jgi:SAM-dependent methyltransferase
MSDAIEWDERYADRLWSGRANGVLVVEVETMRPGRVLDVGCGEGGDAIWLARRGWAVTAVDVSQVAIDRGVEAARAAGVEVTWQWADLLATPPPAGAFDLVSLHYPALRHTADDATIDHLLDAVAPGGTLLVVGHGPVSPEFAHSHGFDPAEYLQPPDFTDRLGAGWTVVTNERRLRVDHAHEGSPMTHDVVLRALRS